MTTSPVDRLDRIEAILERLAIQDANTTSNMDRLTTKVDDLTSNMDRLTTKVDDLTSNMDRLTTRVDDLTYKFDDFMGTANTVLARSAVLDDIIVRLDRNFEENQKSTNAALERLEAILIKLMEK